jgi:rhodanese-related sulfurtransferase
MHRLNAETRLVNPRSWSRDVSRYSSRVAFAGLCLLAPIALALAGCHPVKRVEGWWSRKPHPAFKKVNATVAYEITRDSPGIFILDLRRSKEFQSDTGHLLHAYNLPLSRLPYQLLSLAPYREDTFLVYCRGNDACGEDGMRILTASGFDDAMLIDGGIDRWIKEGYKRVLTLAGSPKGTNAGPLEPPTESTPPPP